MSDPRVAEILDILIRLAEADFNITFEASENNDEVDAIGVGLSMVAEEMEATVASKQKLNKALQENQYLLKEIHHRVKNNLQVIASLLRMQVRLTDDENFKSVLMSLTGRVNSMAMVHQMLYAEGIDSISMKSYLTQLITSIVESFTGPFLQVDLNLRIEDGLIDINQASPLGMLINEIITNAIKHGFKNKENGLIEVDVNFQGEECIIRISDNGNGFNSDQEFDDSLGMKLIKILCAQLKARIEVSSNESTAYMVTFERMYPQMAIER